ncbi:hypothetical protein K2173_002232 [Erythroxylum novogranatense]|uniref:Mediator of RNA polymerase II transcription subunit 28 n=1 Tax=Erythroxylum novogranatense TaxID=1862640 RepID=A0AAV8TBM5_9ROSI|nr:hypothetical protein K2173_002232 [Erythroxylum novogranatense]
MAERQGVDEQQQHQLDPPQLHSPSQQQLPSAKEDMLSFVMALEASLLPCLPARELQAIDRSPHPSHQIDVERHARDFMEAAKRLQLYFIGLQREGQPTEVGMLKMVIKLHWKRYYVWLLYYLLLSFNEFLLDATLVLSQKIAAMEEELKKMDEIVKKQERLIQNWKEDLTDQLEKQKNELQRV